MFRCRPTHERQSGIPGIEVEVEMEVEIDVMIPRDLEQASDVTFRIGVHIGATAKDFCPALQSFDEQGFRAGPVKKPFLREGADFDINQMRMGCGKIANGLETSQADGRVDLDMRAHPGCALRDAGVQGRHRERTGRICRGGYAFPPVPQ
ncbi:hypothetical protein GCM10011360_00400 [Primorskyibacter flagellatus]|uniref:Uncharacterized protein n=1 Tax=Primorskyibacter flagellatus TaxID=1387277 RepID=A0A916ZV16_9RHOB|nr:hypothetical protein GCM10011360_00400 [Primorskyibacter flagellatus]